MVGKLNLEMFSTDVKESKTHGKFGMLDSKEANRCSARSEQLKQQQKRMNMYLLSELWDQE